MSAAYLNNWLVPGEPKFTLKGTSAGFPGFIIIVRAGVGWRGVGTLAVALWWGFQVSIRTRGEIYCDRERRRRVVRHKHCCSQG